jgi:hypothetical protein
LALKSGEWFFLFVILDHHFLHAIHLNDWSKFPRPPLDGELQVNDTAFGDHFAAAVTKPIQEMAEAIGKLTSKEK